MELYSTEPVWVDDSSDPTAQELIGHVKNAIRGVLDVEAGVVCSPGSDDQASHKLSELLRLLYVVAEVCSK